MNYTVKLKDKEVYDNCEKHHLQLLQDGQEIQVQRVSFSNWQLNDDNYTDRVKQWADRRTPDNVAKDDIQVDINE